MWVTGYMIRGLHLPVSPHGLPLSSALITKKASGVCSRIRQRTLKDVEVILVDSGSPFNRLDCRVVWSSNIEHPPKNSLSDVRSAKGSKKRRAVCVIASAHVYPVYPEMAGDFASPISRL